MCYRCIWKSILQLIIKQFLNLMYSICFLIHVSMHLCIYVSIALSIYTLDIWTGCRWYLKAIRDMPDDGNQLKTEMHLEAVINRVWKSTYWPISRELRDALRGQYCIYLEIHFVAMKEETERCTWRPRSSKLRDALGGCDRASIEMHLEAVIKWTYRCTLRPWWNIFGDVCPRPWSSKLGGVLGGG